MDPMYPAAPGARPRPTVVTVSSYLLYAVAVVTLLNAVLGLSFLGRTADVYRDAYAGSQAAGTEGLIVAAAVISAVVYVLFAIGLVVLALFNNRGRNPARITTWVVGGISLCCSGFGLAGNAMTGSFNMQGAGTGMPDPQEVQRRIDEALPSWAGPVTTILSVFTLLAILAALILLALPAANEFFRKPAPGWDPAMPGLPYPGGPNPPYPGQQFPGQPYAGQPYPGQPYPGQPYPGQPQPGQQSPAQPYPGQPQPGQQPYPAYPPQPYPGQQSPAQPDAGQPGAGQPDAGQAAPQQPYPGAPSAPPSGPPADQPHTGSVPAADPWHAPPGDDASDRPPADRPPADRPPADRPPTDRPPTDPPSAV